MSEWEELKLEDKLVKILAGIPKFEKGRHLGRPFLTSYQIAIEFKRRYADDFARLGLPIGLGEVGTGMSLAQYLAQQLSHMVRENHPHIEGGVLAYHYMEDLTFDDDGDVVRPSRFPVAMFRYVDNEQ